MIKAWALRTASERTPHLAMLVAPLAILILVFSTRGAALWPDLWPGLSTALLVGVGAVALVAGTWSLRAVVDRRRDGERLLIVGREELATPLLRDVIGKPGAGANGRWQGWVGAGTAEPRHYASAVTFDPARLKELIRVERITRIIVAEPGLESRQEIASALLECRLLGVEVVDAVDFYQRAHGKIWLKGLVPGRLVFSEGFRLTPAYLLVKRLVDVVCALALLALLAPLLLVLGYAVLIPLGIIL